MKDSAGALLGPELGLPGWGSEAVAGGGGQREAMGTLLLPSPAVASLKTS